MIEDASLDEEIDEAGRDTYLARVKSLFDEVRSWLDGTGLSAKEESVELWEERYGKYTAPVLKLLDGRGRRVAHLNPVGANIIGAHGRVDLIGTLAKEILVYLTDGGPVFSTKIKVGEGVIEEKSRPLFRGIDAPGWYWSESPIRRKATKFDRAILLELLSGISDYES